MTVSPKAGKPAEPAILIDVPKLVHAYYTGRPDPSVIAQRVVFGTSGHRGCSLENSFNEAHILAITQAICLYRKQQGIDGRYTSVSTRTRSRNPLSKVHWRCWPATASK
jgi:phosphoglucomutase